jgi:hypothetical protein
VVAKKDVPQGDYGMISVGPYDDWAIEYGYSFEKDLKPIIAKNTQPELAYGTDEDSGGPDPRVRRYDFAKDPLSYAENQMTLVREHRGKLLDKFVKDGDSWSKARRGYQLTLLTQVNSVMMMSNWLGGSFTSRSRKGDANAAPPVEPIPVAQQRDALKFVLTNTFPDEAYGLSPNLLKFLTVDKWFDMENNFEEPNWPVHDRVLGIQASAMTAILNPVTLSRVFDNEFRTPADQDSVTLPEVLNTVRAAAWSELDNVDAAKKFSDRQPLISSLRRNLQREHIDRLIDLANNRLGSAPAAKPISDLAATQLTELRDKLNAAAGNGNLDNYTRAHLRENAARITKVLEARYVLVK